MTSGIGNGASTLPWQAQVESIAKQPLLFAPGTKTLYSDTNFDLLGELIEQRTGEKYGTFIQNQILDTARDVRNPGAGPVPHGPEPGGRLQLAQARELAEGRDAERTAKCTPPPGWSRQPRTWPPI